MNIAKFLLKRKKKMILIMNLANHQTANLALMLFSKCLQIGKLILSLKIEQNFLGR